MPRYQNVIRVVLLPAGEEQYNQQSNSLFLNQRQAHEDGLKGADITARLTVPIPIERARRLAASEDRLGDDFWRFGGADP